MALTDENNMVMPVAPMYGNNNNGWGGFGGDGWWIILLLLCANGGWGFGGGFGGLGGFGMMNGMLGYDFPWLMTGQQNINTNTNNGFRDAMINDNITSVLDGIAALSTQLCGCCGDMQMGMANGFASVQNSLCSGFAGVNASINGAQNALAQQLYTNQIADLERSFAAQTANTQGMTALQSQLAQCCCDNRLATADTKYTIAAESCATRTADASNTRDIIDSQTRGTQAILDKLCTLELDGYKRENDNLRTQLNMANLAASQTAQTAQILQGQAAEIDGVYNRLKNCPVGTVPVFGNQPIFTCAQNIANTNTGCGSCGCGGF